MGMGIVIKVDYDKSLKQIIDNVWLRYDWPDPDIYDATSVDEFLPTERGIKDIKIEIFSFRIDIAADKVIQHMNNLNYRPATLRELIAVTPVRRELHKTLSYDYTVLALGTVWERKNPPKVNVCGGISQTYRGCMSVPTYLTTQTIDYPFTERISFAAISKSSSQ